MEPFFSIVIPNHKADRRLGGNSRASWHTKYRLLKADKELAYALVANELNRMGLSGQAFLTNLGQYTVEECLPVHVTFKRYYTGRARLMDSDNVAGCYKGAADGVAAALGVNDRHFKTNVEQIRGDFTELEIEICPSWALKEGTTNL